MTDHIPAEIRRQVVRDAGFRCGYCQSDQSLSGIPLSVEHIVPRTLGGESVIGNLWLSCRACNEHKGARVDAEDPESGERVALFNPRTQKWSDHFAWREDGTIIIGLTPTGRVTVATLHLNRLLLVRARRRWVSVGWHPPQDNE